MESEAIVSVSSLEILQERREGKRREGEGREGEGREGEREGRRGRG